MKKIFIGIGIFFAATTFAAENLQFQKIKIEKRIAQLQAALEKINAEIAKKESENVEKSAEILEEKISDEKKEILEFAENFVAKITELPKISSLEKKTRKQELREILNAAKTKTELEKAANFEEWILSPVFERVSWEEFLNLSDEQKKFIKIEFARKNPKKLSPKASRFDQINFLRYKTFEEKN